MTAPLPDVSLAADFPKTAERFEAWWHGELIDRAVVSPGVKQEWQQPPAHSTHPSVEARWFDVDYQLDRAITRLEQTAWLGDALPVVNPNIGPELTTALLGAELSFSETTSWAEHFIESPDQWEQISQCTPGFDNRYWRFIETMTREALARNDGRYLVGLADLHGSFDMLSGVRDPQMLCMDLIDCPDAVRAAAMHAADVFVQGLQCNHDLLGGQGSTTWTAMYHRGLAYIPSCDFWCMVSPDDAAELILPTIQREMQPMDRSLFHLDGPDALRHLDLLLEMPGLDAVQWVYGAGNGPAARWIDVYQKILAAGRSVQVKAHDGADALAVLEATGAPGVWFTIAQRFNHVADGQAFLQEVERLSVPGRK